MSRLGRLIMMHKRERARYAALGNRALVAHHTRMINLYARTSQ